MTQTFKWHRLALIALLVFLSHKIAPAALGADVRAAVEEANKEFITAIGRADAAALAGMYATEAILLPPHSDMVRGKQAIEQFWDGVIKSGIKGGMLTTLDLEQKGKTAFETGKYTLTGDGGKVIDNGKYVVIWKRQKGKWKIHRDIWNTSMPAPVSKP